MKQYKFGFDLLHLEFKHFVFGYHPDMLAATATMVRREQPSQEDRTTPGPSTASDSVQQAAH
jgi:hypothetical protein